MHGRIATRYRSGDAFGRRCARLCLVLGGNNESQKRSSRPARPHGGAGLRRSGRGAEIRRRAQDPAHGHAAQRVDPRGGDGLRRRPVHVALQQPRDVRPARAEEQPRDGGARPGHQVGVEGRQHQAGLHAARGRALARRPAVQRQGRRLHLRPAAGRREREQAQAQSAFVVVDQRREGHRRQRHPGHVPSQGAAALAAGAARLGLHTDLPLPRPARPDAAQAGRHRPVQARRVQDERRHQAGEEHRLLEEGPALSRRHRVHHHARPGDPHAGLHRRQVRHDLPDRRLGAAP